MKTLKIVAIGAVATLVAFGLLLGGLIVLDTEKANQAQTDLQPFYDLPDPLPDVEPGTILRSEPMSDLGWELENANAFRILYMSAGPNGDPRVSSGMIFVPTKPTDEPRPLVSYAHGTAGFGAGCAPSRNRATPAAMPWVQSMMDDGWVLTATDYVGVGTTGTPYYLIGRSEAADVLNAARAARNFPEANAGRRITVMGQSQGGHSALWTGELATELAPELDLLGVSASAPAAELVPLVTASWDIANAWALGPDVLVSWPAVDPDLNIDDVTTEAGRDNYQDFAYKCVENSLLEGQVDFELGVVPFSKDPNEVPAWKRRMEQETPKPYPASLPVQIHVGTGDGLVFPFTQAMLQDKWCKAGSTMQFNWMGDLASGFEAGAVAHGNTVLFGWPTMMTWMDERFKNRPATTNCGTVQPALPPPPEPQTSG